MTAGALPPPPAAELAVRCRRPPGLDLEAEISLAAWAPVEPRPDCEPWTSVVWAGSVVRREVEGTLRQDAKPDVPYRLVSIGVGAAAARFGRALPAMARLDAHHALIAGTERVPGLTVPGHGPLRRDAVVVQGIAAAAPTWDAVATAETNTRGRLEGELIGELAVSRSRALLVVPARWPARGDGVLRWGPAALSEKLPRKVQQTVLDLGAGERSPIVRVQDTAEPEASRWGWWLGVSPPMRAAGDAHAVRIAVDAESLEDAQALAAAIAWHQALANADGEDLWPTIPLRQQLQRRLGDATRVRRHTQELLMQMDWAPAQGKADTTAV